ncbi:amino acid ABC transporter substrate-binding protein [Shewanella xiamenensis]|uniref:substrate-binding periplasmic protein n=1 Tax=Shewanella xiamenensis TaxID=332186 RepID=UPI001185C2EF|nr:transporter substrate-binding domain-containing protein [Shewanella xiamenensis]TVL24428.1 amino acid ABC transporter substrate-binding protein [Shewanella xiamenensis]TVL25009.1 amino acid ABC transporter substrate-binding protein [Shewanella xiamenensis]TVL29420.1 amino acid ABC transporter substrate-binding protein [Shewanella xiamenensis]TVL38818.1 amino acid ABC transporter substrate-binding protein [Shewanella xiamenensis]TVP05553.1 amino acid ABC transporter substrate-binding protein
MPKCIFQFSHILLLYIFIFPAWSVPSEANVSACSNPIKVGYNDWPPYAWQDMQGEAQGLDVELLRAFAEFLGCEINFINVPAKRSHQMLKSGSLDIMMGATKTVEREEYSFFSDPYRDEEVRLFVLDENKDNVKLERWQDIFTQKLRLLVPISGWYGADYEKTRERLALENLLILSPDVDKSVQMLTYDRADLMIGDAIAMPYIASQHQGIRLSALKPILDHNPIHLMLSKKSISPLLLAQFNRAIKALTINGEIARIVYKWQQISLAQQSKISNQYGPFYRLYAGLLTFDIAR